MAGWDVQLYAYIFSVYLCVCVGALYCSLSVQRAYGGAHFLKNDLMHAAPAGQSPVRAPRGRARRRRPGAGAGARRATDRHLARGWAEAGGAPRALRGILRQHISKSTTIRLIYNRKYALISLDKSMSMCTVSASEHL